MTLKEGGAEPRKGDSQQHYSSNGIPARDWRMQLVSSHGAPLEIPRRRYRAATVTGDDPVPV